MKLQRDWNPVRSGKYYCSPACGCGCTYQAFKQANASAKKMISAMKNPDKWQAEVWENCGWHYSIKCGLLAVTSGHLKTQFSAHYDHQHWCDAKTPQKAADKVLKSVKDEIKRLQAITTFFP